jgi:hypothetical protein
MVFELFAEPTTMTSSASAATLRMATWRFVVA